MQLPDSMSRANNYQAYARLTAYMLLVGSVVSFTSPTKPQKPRRPSFVRTSTLDEREGVEKSDLFSATYNTPHQSFRETELWLDLRETAIAPREALEFLEKNLYSNEENMSIDTSDVQPRQVLSLIHKILLSEQLFSKVISRDETADLPLLYTVDEGSVLVESNIQSNQSFPSGKVVTCRHTEILDPLSAIAITSAGQWLFVDKTDGSDDKEKILWLEKQVTGLVDFLTSASAAPVMASQHSGLLLPSVSKPSVLSTVRTGGVAVACRTRTAFVQLNSALEQSMGSAMITQTTASGILVTVEAPSGSEKHHPVLRTALVLPLDLRIWETARDIRDIEEEGNDEYED